MSMFQIGLSGLKSTQTALEVTSNNISNSSTSGFKTGSTEFAAVYNGGQRGGVKVADIKEDFTKPGDLVRTDKDLDMAITGKGFFVIAANGREAYTQAGQFGLNDQLYITNSNGAKLQGYGVDDAAEPNIVPGVLTDLKIEGSNIPAQSSDLLNFSGNFSSASDVIPYPAAPDSFDPTNGSAYNFSQSTELYDSLGNSHVLTQYYNHTGANQWQTMYFVDGQPLTAAQLGLPGSATVGSQDVSVDGANVSAGVVTMTFDTDGQMLPLDGTFTPGAVADSNSTDPYNMRRVQLTFSPLDADGNPNGAGDVSLTIDMKQSTQFGSGFAMYTNDANGYTSGEFNGVTVDDDGKLYATFTNGESKLQGQLVLATFANVDGLEQGDNTVWYGTSESGSPLYTTADNGTVGQLLSGQYMASNVNISDQLVDLISFQQNYQANAKTISTASDMMQVLFNAV
ncbi:flagellar hook-basal body complex protein [Shewanella dokdonensis]|uniref:Flagellar hook protein FlgE n=1 Tax=Shewanella dokdonensis TaxID=712036 RepID=A0ABX8DG32_9GAMM|nr:flagellar hook-basal body complex protein [Shewanella dokdonensis]MCL1073478.1 flagellar hook-basal body complex protein [Shewanella dokdonensis]QVK22732.1 flagellar hook-basal body complex protein [Shewanella dokdonensis]